MDQNTPIEIAANAARTPRTLPMSAAAGISFIEEDPDLAGARKRALVCDLKAAARFAGLPTTNLLLTPEDLRERLLGLSGSGVGVSLGRWRNVLSSLTFVMRRAGIIDPAGGALSPAWERLLSLVDRHQRVVFGGLAIFCSARGIEPADVGLTAFTDLEVYLVNRTLTTNPRKLIGSIRSAWNKCSRDVELWPGKPIDPIPDANKYTLPIEAFPASFGSSVDEFLDRLSTPVWDLPLEKDGPMGDSGDAAAAVAPIRPLRPSSIATRRDHLRWAASAVVASGVPAAEISSLSALVTPIERALNAIKYLYHRSGDQPSAAGMHVSEALLMIAKYVGGSSSSDIARIKRYAARVRLVYNGMTERNHRRVTAMRDPAREAQLLALPPSLMCAARNLRAEDPVAAAHLALRAVAIGILASIPLRLDNLCRLDMVRHLLRPVSTTGRISHITIADFETKNRRPITVPVSEQLSAMLNEWIQEFRPAIADATCQYVFPGHGTGDKPISRPGLRLAIVKTMKRHVGVPLNPHAFRHLAAFRFLDEFPGEFESVRQLLGHIPGGNSAERYYAGADSESAFKRFYSLGANLKGTASKSGDGGRRLRAAEPGNIKGGRNGR